MRDSLSYLDNLLAILCKQMGLLKATGVFLYLVPS